MDFSKLNRIEFDDLIPGNKYYIEIMKTEKHKSPGTGQQYGIFDNFDIINDEKLYAVFTGIYDFKDPVTKEMLSSSIGRGRYNAYRHRNHFVFYEPRFVTYNRKQNECLGKVIEQITKDSYMAEYFTKKGWLDIE